jgi:uncharacterized membrane protein
LSQVDVLVFAYFSVAIALSFVAAWLTSRRAAARGRRAWLWAALGLLFGVFALAAVSLLPAKDAAAGI